MITKPPHRVKWDKIMETKEERTESVFISVTPSVKKELESKTDNKKLQEEIIRNFLKSETDWLSGEIKEIDEATIKYQAKLIGIKDNFRKAQDLYVQEIEGVYDEAKDVLNKLDNDAQGVLNKITKATNSLTFLCDEISKINTHKIQGLIDTLKQYEQMSSEQKELIGLILNPPDR
jgi:hypothetical protein